jgi:23S rRNA (pseudouridine1915-N3)-methyltransferase
VKVTLLAVGKLRPHYRAAADEYGRRLRRYARFNEYEVREASRAPTVSAQLSEEASRLGPRIPEGSTLVALTREGSAWSSTDLARQLEHWLMKARPLVLVIGGSQGLHSSLATRASSRWSLGPLTFPHELARVVVLEQLYRGFTMLKGEPYHKGAGS